MLGLTCVFCSSHRSVTAGGAAGFLLHTRCTAILSFSDTLKYCQTGEAILASLFCRTQRKVSCILHLAIGIFREDRSIGRERVSADIDRHAKTAAFLHLLMGNAICEVLSFVVKRSALHHGGKRQKVAWS